MSEGWPHFAGQGDNPDAEELVRLFQLSLDLLCVAGTDGYFKQINPAFERVLGYSRDELLSRGFLEFVHPDDHASTLREVERLAQGEEVVDFQNRYRAKDGSYRWLAWRSAPLAEQGLIYAVARDITEQKKTEALLAKRTAELERTNRDLDEFASVASHDLRAPLRGIANLAEWIEEDLPGELPASVSDNLAKLRAQVQRMQRVIDELLAFARAGRESAPVETVDVAALIEGVVQLLEPPEGMQVEIGSAMPTLETHRPPLEQVLRNLIGNAIQYHDRPDGRIRVTARERERFWEFHVSDDGPGIPLEAIERVFRMFQRLQPGGGVQGTGIGLPLVKRIVQAYGGRVWVQSDGRGSDFGFTWPRSVP